MLLRPDSGGRQGVITRRKRNAIETAKSGREAAFGNRKTLTQAYIENANAQLEANTPLPWEPSWQRERAKYDNKIGRAHV